MQSVHPAFPPEDVTGAILGFGIFCIVCLELAWRYDYLCILTPPY